MLAHTAGARRPVRPPPGRLPGAVRRAVDARGPSACRIVAPSRSRRRRWRQDGPGRATAGAGGAPRAAGRRDARRRPRRALRGAAAARGRRLRRGLPRPRPAARPRRRDQADPPGVVRRPRPARGREASLPPRGPGRGPAAAPEHRHDPRHRLVAVHELHRDGARQRRDAAGPARGPRPASSRRGAAGRRADRQGARPRARERRRPPGREARERDDRAVGRGEGHGLRHREGGGRPAHRDRPRDRDAELHVARAGARRDGGRAVRPLLARLRALRVPDGPAPVRGGERRVDPRARAHRGAARGGRGCARSAVGHGRRPPPRNCQGPVVALPHRRRDDRGAACSRRFRGADADGVGGSPAARARDDGRGGERDAGPEQRRTVRRWPPGSRSSRSWRP